MPLNGRVNDPRYITPFPHANVVTSVPFTYRDGLTTLEIIETLKRHLEWFREHVSDDFRELWDGFDNLTNDTNAALDSMKSYVDGNLDAFHTMIEALAGEQLVYNPTNGGYEESKNVTRDLFRELAVFGARVNQMATLTCEQAAQVPNLEMAVIGNYTVFDNKEPRVTA